MAADLGTRCNYVANKPKPAGRLQRRLRTKASPTHCTRSRGDECVKWVAQGDEIDSRAWTPRPVVRSGATLLSIIALHNGGRSFRGPLHANEGPPVVVGLCENVRH